MDVELLLDLLDSGLILGDELVVVKVHARDAGDIDGINAAELGVGDGDLVDLVKLSDTHLGRVADGLPGELVDLGKLGHADAVQLGGLADLELATNLLEGLGADAVDLGVVLDLEVASDDQRTADLEVTGNILGNNDGTLDSLAVSKTGSIGLAVNGGGATRDGAGRSGRLGYKREKTTSVMGTANK